MSQADATKDQQATESPASANGASPAEQQGGDSSAELQATRNEAAEFKDKYLRSLAEMDNFRKRQERSTTERVERVKRDMLAHVLDVLDNLDRAMAYESTMDRDGMLQTLRMVQSQLNDVLRREGVTPVEAVGQPFNPHVHEAIETVPSSEHTEGTVAGEVRRGYMIGSDLLRPARVQVSSGSQPDGSSS
ncbi:MAG: nucleotide exchange factor GrpE [Ktedonobacterales bacterium]